MSAVYDKLGIRFSYPENWKIADEQADSRPRSVSVESPSGGFWSVAIYSPQCDSAELIETAVEAMRQEYADLEVEPLAEQVAGNSLYGVEIHFTCLDLVVAAHIQTIDIDDRTLLLLCQAEDREFDRLENVFRAITTSLLRPDSFANV